MAIDNNNEVPVGGDVQNTANVSDNSLANLDIETIQGLNTTDGSDSGVREIAGDVAITGGNVSTGMWRASSDAGFADQASLCCRENSFAPLHAGKLGANFAAILNPKSS